MSAYTPAHGKQVSTWADRSPQVVAGWKPPAMNAPRPGTELPRATLSPAPAPIYTPPAPSPRSLPSPVACSSSVPATASPPPATPAPTTQPASAGAPMKEPTMARRSTPPVKGARKTGRPTSTGKVSPQFQICALLMAEGKLTRAELTAKVDVETDKALSSALANAKTAKRITRDKATGTYAITDAGRAWASGGANLDNQRAKGRTSPAAVKRARREPVQRGNSLAKSERQRLGVVPVTANGTLRGGLHLATSDGEVIPAPSYRCDIGSDGCYRLQKGGIEISLTMPETLDMLRYVDRIRGVDAPAAASA